MESSLPRAALAFRVRWRHLPSRSHFVISTSSRERTRSLSHRPQSRCTVRRRPCSRGSCYLDRDNLLRADQIRPYATASSDEQAKENLVSPDYWTNDGVIEGVWIFSRHGDRTPSRPLSPEHRRDDEAAFWMTKLPIPDSATVFEAFSKFFPVEKQKGPGLDDTFIDVSRNPFGFLTSKGLQQLSENGRRFFNRYNNHAHHFPDCEDWQSAQDFLSVWDVQVFSTNYLRTIMSAQSFLDGMFATRCYNLALLEQDRAHDPAIIKEQRIPCARTDHANTDKGPLVKIKVRDLRHDPLYVNFERWSCASTKMLAHPRFRL